MPMNWFNRNRAAAAAGDAQPSGSDTVSGSVTVRLYPPPAHITSSVEIAAQAGQRLFGTCTICGAVGKFESFNENLRESGACPKCRSSNRQRQMGWMLRRELGLAAFGPLRVSEGIRVLVSDNYLGR
jgi:hypothetical protein